MKRFLCAVCVLALVFVLAACSTAKHSNSSGISRNTTPSAHLETINEEHTTEAPAIVTHEYPVAYVCGVLGLILISSAGLMLLRRF